MLQQQESWIAQYESGRKGSNTNNVSTALSVERPSGTIHDAAESGKLEDVRKFIQSGDDVNMKDEKVNEMMLMILMMTMTIMMIVSNDFLTFISIYMYMIMDVI